MSSEQKKEISKVIVLLLLTLIPIGWTLVNADGFILPAIMQIVLIFMSIGWILVFNKFGKKVRLIGIDRNIGVDFLIGIGIGIGIIILTFFNIIGSFLLPYVPASFTTDLGTFNITVLGAMIMESVLFFMLMINFFDEKLDSWNINLPFVVAVIISGLIFAFYHYYTYILAGGTVNDVIGSFISIIIVTFIWGYTMKWTKSILPLIISHGIINFYLLNLQLHWIVI